MLRDENKHSGNIHGYIFEYLYIRYRSRHRDRWYKGDFSRVSSEYHVVEKRDNSARNSRIYSADGIGFPTFSNVISIVTFEVDLVSKMRRGSSPCIGAICDVSLAIIVGLRGHRHYACDNCRLCTLVIALMLHQGLCN